MRISRLSLPLLALAAACGGAQKPAESSADTSSLETSHASDKDMPAAPESASTSSSASAPAAASASGASGGAGDASSAPAAASTHPAPSVTGAIDGKAFSPKLAHVVGKLQKDKRLLIALDERTDCPIAGDAKPDDAALTILVPWEDGYKIDLSALKRASKKAPNEIGFSRVNAAGKKEYSTTFKPSGRLTVVKAPMDKDSTGKLNIDLQSGDYMLAGDLDIQVCVAPK